MIMCGCVYAVLYVGLPQARPSLRLTSFLRKEKEKSGKAGLYSMCVIPRLHCSWPMVTAGWLVYVALVQQLLDSGRCVWQVLMHSTRNVAKVIKYSGDGNGVKSKRRSSTHSLSGRWEWETRKNWPDGCWLTETGTHPEMLFLSGVQVLSVGWPQVLWR